jgi:hypothetical protein
MTFKAEYIREKRTGVWHVTRDGSGRTLCGRKIVSDLERSWPGNPREKRCESCVEKKREPYRG